MARKCWCSVSPVRWSASTWVFVCMHGYVVGGYNAEGPVDEIWKFSFVGTGPTQRCCWSQVRLQRGTPSPFPRMMFRGVTLPTGGGGGGGGDQSGGELSEVPADSASAAAAVLLPLATTSIAPCLTLFVFGGVDHERGACCDLWSLTFASGNGQVK